MRAAALCITLLLPVVAFAVARAYTVNVGYYDDWEWSTMVLAMRHGELMWNYMWALHNNHRLLVPDLVALAVARFGAWSMPRETTLSVGIAALTQVVWYATVARIVALARRIAVFLAISLLIFSLAQGENWIWGLQMSWFLANLGIACTAFAATWRDSRWHLAAVAGGMLAALVAANSIAYGLNALLVGTAIAVASRRRSRLEIGAWLLLTSVVFGAYLHDYTKGLALTPAMSAPERVVQSVLFALAFLGSPLARSFGLASSIVAGALGLAAYAYALVAYVRLRRADVAEAEPLVIPLAVAIVPLVTAPEVAYSRLWEGMQTALASRFITAASLLWIAVLLLYGSGKIRVRVPRTVTAAAIAVTFAGWIGAQFAGFDDIRSRAFDIYAAAQALPRHRTATESEMKWLWPAEVFVDALEGAKEGPFAEPATSR